MLIYRDVECRCRCRDVRDVEYSTRKYSQFTEFSDNGLL